MLITPGPLTIVPNDRGDAYWLRTGQTGTAVASVWRGSPHGATADGNAAVMANADELYRLAVLVTAVSDKEKLQQARAIAKRVIAAIEASLPGKEETP